MSKTTPFSLLTCRGASLIEVLVTLILLGVGLLGYAQMQLKGIKQSNESLQVTTAMLLSEDIIERVRSNRNEALKGADSQYNNPGISETIPTCAGKNDNGDFDTSLVCTPEQLAIFDIHEWQENLKNSFPNATGIICVDSSAEDPTTASLESIQETGCDSALYGDRLIYTVRIIWDGGSANPVNGKLGNNRAYIGSFEP